jgi:hypothetical protein
MAQKATSGGKKALFKQKLNLFGKLGVRQSSLAVKVLTITFHFQSIWDPPSDEAQTSTGVYLRQGCSQGSGRASVVGAHLAQHTTLSTRDQVTRPHGEQCQLCRHW